MAYTFDTSAWIEYFVNPELENQINKIINEDTIFTPTIVLAEIADIFTKSKKDINEIKLVLNFVKIRSELVPINAEIALNAGIVKKSKRKKHKSISLLDCIIIEISKWTGTKVLSADKHILDEPNAISLKEIQNT